MKTNRETQNDKDQLPLINKTENNKIKLKGIIGGEIKYHETDSGKKKANFNVSTGIFFENRLGGKEWLWHSVVAWGNKADQVTEYLKTGDKVIVVGRIHRRKYTNKDNQQRVFTEIVLKNFTK
ncbi:MAG: single-stranded DNA-binding protein [Bacteroidota bacterium]|jgi:single-strand DNA-binding protein